MVSAERKFIDDRVMKIIELKNKVSGPLNGDGQFEFLNGFRCAVVMIRDSS